MINYQILAKENTQTQGVNVNLSAEYKKGGLPTTIDANCNGANPQGGYMSMVAKYDIETNNFTVINGSNIPDGFVEELKTKIVEFYNKIKNGDDTND